jgi:hypothetical protein
MKIRSNYAFIDGTNLYITSAKLGWRLDLRRFRVYLKDHYHVVKAYYFLGYVESNKALYRALESWGYTMVYKPVKYLLMAP